MSRNKKPNHLQRSVAFQDSPPNAQLPHEILPDYPLGRLFAVIAGMLAVVVVFNLLMIIFLGEYTTNFGYFLSYQKWQLLKRIDTPVEWLFLGDSSLNQGFIPSVFEEQFEGVALNLGTNGDMITLDDLWMLEYYIQKFGPPENVIIVHVYDIWHRDFNPVLLGQIPLAWGFWKEFSATENLVWNREIQRDIFLERYVPIFSQNKTLGDIIQNTFLGLKNPFKPLWDIDPKGYTSAYEPKPEIVMADARDHIQFASENSFVLSDINESSIAEFKRLAEEHEINLYIVLGPQYEGMVADQGFRTYLNDLMDELSAYASQSENIHFIPEIKTFPADQMQNSDHLIDSSAREYTIWIAEQIRNLR